MRQIESDMLTAICQRVDFYKDNTAVIFSDHVGNPHLDATVYLHGHSIAEVLPDGSFEINTDTLQEWPTRTTVSRLRALGFDVRIKNGVPLVNGVDL